VADAENTAQPTAEADAKKDEKSAYQKRKEATALFTELKKDPGKRKLVFDLLLEDWASGLPTATGVKVGVKAQEKPPKPAKEGEEVKVVKRKKKDTEPAVNWLERLEVLQDEWGTAFKKENGEEGFRPLPLTGVLELVTLYVLQFEEGTQLKEKVNRAVQHLKVVAGPKAEVPAVAKEKARAALEEKGKRSAEELEELLRDLVG
jgi:hypothetical protein